MAMDSVRYLSSIEVPDDSIVRLLEQARRYYDDRILATVLGPSLWHSFMQKDRKFRYAYISRPEPHEFDGQDAKAVFRRMRRGKFVSPGLVQRAAGAMWRGGYDAGVADAD
jgi:hypothetical protein